MGTFERGHVCVRASTGHQNAAVTYLQSSFAAHEYMIWGNTIVWRLCKQALNVVLVSRPSMVAPL